MKGKQRIVTTALQILLGIKGLVAPACTLLLGFLLCTQAAHIYTVGQAVTALSALRCRTSLQSLLIVNHLSGISHLDFRQVFRVVFASGLFSSNVCFHQSVDALSCFVLEPLFHSRDLIKLLIPHLWSPPSIYVLGVASVTSHLTCV